MSYFIGIDLHSTSTYIGVIDQDNRKVFSKKFPNELDSIVQALEPFRSTAAGIVVESTYNWYWLVDGLKEKGYRVHLANPSAIKQYEGLKHTDDVTDAFHLANLLRLGILPAASIYPKTERPVRDLLRKRLHLVQQRTAQILSVQNLLAWNLAIRMTAKEVKKLNVWDAARLFAEEHLIVSAAASIGTIGFLGARIKELEKAVRTAGKLKSECRLLQTVPGIGVILALTIMYETGEIGRFAQVGNYVSYCRCVKSPRFSNGKSKGYGNRKNGNRYLSWVFVEAANIAVWNYGYVKSYYQRKAARTNTVVAIKAVAHKRARACYHIITQQQAFDPNRAFAY
jgi:transposase